MTSSRSSTSCRGLMPLRRWADAPGARRAVPMYPDSNATFVLGDAARIRGSACSAKTVEGDESYPNLHAIPGPVEAVVIGTRPDSAEATVRESIDLGIWQVWMHGPRQKVIRVRPGRVEGKTLGEQ
jgi:hypothetical protein